MPTDIYTKAVLTVIAVALSVIASNQFLNPAQAQYGDQCGGFHDPCHIKVTNWPMF